MIFLFETQFLPWELPGVTSPLQGAGLNRHEVENERVLQERSSEPPGPESCAATARDPAKRRQGIGGVGDRASKRCNPDADVFALLTAIVLLHIEIVQENAVGGDLLLRCESRVQIIMLKR